MEIKDIFDGKVIDIWEDDKDITIAFRYATVSIPKENWEILKEDFRKISNLVR